jgi:hypothetical protein
LRPLFLKLANSDDWLLQTHGILGLAELAPEKRADPWLIKRLAASRETDARGDRGVTLLLAMDLDLLGPEQVPGILEWEDLRALPKIRLLCFLAGSGQTPDLTIVEPLAAHEDIEVAGLASCLLANFGTSEPLEAYLERLSKEDDRLRQQMLWLLCEGIDRYRFDGMLAFVKRETSTAAPDSRLAFAGLAAMLSLDPATGARRYADMLAAEPSMSTRIRCGLLVLRAGPGVPTSTWDGLAGEGQLADRLARAGKAINGPEAADALIALVDSGHQPSIEAVLDVTKKLDPSIGREVYGALIDRVDDDGANTAEVIANAIVAATRLMDLDADLVANLVRVAPDDGIRQEVLLHGLLASDSPRATEIVSGVRRIGAGRADSLALLVLARHAESLDVEDLRRLGVIAAGGRRVDSVLRVQAAWLYIRLTGRTEIAMSRIFSNP